jgi:lipopolysaccharide heptosyltransferase III
MKRILFVSSNRIGDAVLSTGLLDHLLRACPEVRFTVACGTVAEGVFLRMPRLDRLILMEKRRDRRHWLPLWAATAFTAWDLVVDIRASALSFLVPARRRARMRRGTGPKVAQLATILGLDPPPLPVVWTAPADEARAATLLPPGKHPGGKLLILAPTANWAGKIWPAERFVELGQALLAGPLAGAAVAIMAGPGEMERELAAPVLAAFDLAGNLTLPEAAACLRRASLFIGNDSGLMHLAAAAGSPTLGLFGPTPAEEYAPAGRLAAATVAPDGTMQGLSVAQALAAAAALLERA